MSDVITIIKEFIREYGWLLVLISLLLGTLAAFFGSGWAGRGIIWTFALSRRRKLRRLQRRRARLQQLHDSDREYYGWLLAGALWALALLTLAVVIESYILRIVMSMAAYFPTIKRYMDYELLQDFDRTVARLDSAIAKLEAKQAVQRSAAVT